MVTVLVVLSCLSIVAFLVWVILQPTEETHYGREKRLRREAKREERRKTEGEAGGSYER